MPSHFPLLSLGLILALTSLSLPAQDARWKLPKDGLASYQRTHAWKGWTKKGGKVTGRIGGRVAGIQPLLFEAELDDDKRKVVRTPRDLYAVAPYLAFDLTTLKSGAKLHYEFPLVDPFGRLIVDGRAGPISNNGQQILKLRITRRAADPDKDFPEAFRRSLHHYLKDRIDARMTLKRNGIRSVLS